MGVSERNRWRGGGREVEWGSTVYVCALTGASTDRAVSREYGCGGGM
jgi:hypothetical protein